LGIDVVSTAEAAAEVLGICSTVDEETDVSLNTVDVATGILVGAVAFVEAGGGASGGTGTFGRRRLLIVRSKRLFAT
jgi:hypothetical protein